MHSGSKDYNIASGAITRDEGLRQYMVAVYRYMGLALFVTAIVAFFTSQSPALMAAIFGTPLQYLVMFAPLMLVIWLNSRLDNMSKSSAQLGLFAFSAIMGISLSSIFLVYTSISIARTFLVSASVFGVMSIYGHVTKRDLTSMGSFMIMGVWGILIAGIVNLFMQSPMIDFITSVFGVVIFTGLTAYDTQMIKDNYYYNNGSYGDVLHQVAINGALRLYLDFINLFISLLRLFGNRK